MLFILWWLGSGCLLISVFLLTEGRDMPKKLKVIFFVSITIIGPAILLPTVAFGLYHIVTGRYPFSRTVGRGN